MRGGVSLSSLSCCPKCCILWEDDFSVDHRNGYFPQEKWQWQDGFIRCTEPGPEPTPLEFYLDKHAFSVSSSPGIPGTPYTFWPTIIEGIVEVEAEDFQFGPFLVEGNQISYEAKPKIFFPGWPDEGNIDHSETVTHEVSSGKPRFHFFGCIGMNPKYPKDIDGNTPPCNELSHSVTFFYLQSESEGGGVQDEYLHGYFENLSNSLQQSGFGGTIIPFTQGNWIPMLHHSGETKISYVKLMRRCDCIFHILRPMRDFSGSLVGGSPFPPIKIAENCGPPPVETCCYPGFHDDQIEISIETTVIDDPNNLGINLTGTYVLDRISRFAYQQSKTVTDLPEQPEDSPMKDKWASCIFRTQSGGMPGGRDTMVFQPNFPNPGVGQMSVECYANRNPNVYGVVISGFAYAELGDHKEMYYNEFAQEFGNMGVMPLVQPSTLPLLEQPPKGFSTLEANRVSD